METIMIIIVEGPDGAGKSTLCSLLQKSTGFVLKHLSYKDDNSFEAYIERLLEHNVIFDRFFHSELVYSKVMNRVCALNKDEVATLQVITSKVAEVIFCTAQVETLIKRAFVRGEDYINESHMAAIVSGYERLFVELNTKPTKVELNINETFKL